MIAQLAPLLDTAQDARIAILLGEASKHSGNTVQLDRAADKWLALDPAQVMPLIWKGDVHWAAGDKGRASQFYGTALERGSGKALPARLSDDLDQVEALLEGWQNELAVFLDTYLTRNGLPPERRSARVVQSINIMSGRDATEMGLQRPTLHYLPGLPQQPWYDRIDFVWAGALEAQTSAIREELLSVLTDDAAFAPYLEGDNHGPVRDYQGLLNNPAWGAFYLWRNGVAQMENIARCPKTAAALTNVPRPEIAGRTPTAMFSLLKPGTHIPPHHGMLNSRLICHLPLIVPKSCAMRVGEEARPWVEGKLTVFDDSIEHEAWNQSADTRVVLLFDIPRPELSTDEQRAVALCFAAVDAYHGTS